jgi:hypothetical protein
MYSELSHELLVGVIRDSLGFPFFYISIIQLT